MSRKVYEATVASKGIASGILRRDRVIGSDSANPATSIIGAVTKTLQQLRSLQASAGELGSDILQFQVEMLDDDLFVSELLDRAAVLKDCRLAVQGVLDGQIEGFLQSETETFASRATDLADLRDRLLASFGGADEQRWEVPEGTILLVQDMTPSRFLEIDWRKTKGFVAQSGSTASHVALLARSEGVPMLVGIGELDPSSFECPALIDAVSGRLIVHPEPSELEPVAPVHRAAAVPDAEGMGPAILPDGSRVRVNLSVNSLAVLDDAPSEWFDGIGLVRTELLLHDPQALLSAETQAEIYRPLFDWAADGPVTIRLFDAGGDKPLPGLSLPAEVNPFLGVRGARLLARRPDVLLAQYAAILKAAAGRPARILVPMLTLPREMPFFRDALDRAVEELGADPASVALGMMVETPSAALEIDKFDADFFSIGTNDLIQYTLAVSRDGDALELGDEIAPAVLVLVAKVVEEADKRGIDVTLCGDAATSLVQLKQAIQCGIRSVAIPGGFAPQLKHFIRHGE